jgi:prepilin-type N-terminal cleavage/methylation domain-containing protein
MGRSLHHFRGKTRVSSGLAFRKGFVTLKKASSGFTLIELTIVLVVIGILAAVAIPNYVMMSSRAKEAEVKENAHCVQVAVELYATQNDGVYADANEGSIVGNIVPFLPERQRLKNSFSGARTEPVVGPATNPGEIGYEVRVGADGVNKGYTITGFGRTLTVISLRGGF